ncbi:hypothetical protein V8D89_000996 [Ganoderma adspersum]
MTTIQSSDLGTTSRIGIPYNFSDSQPQATTSTTVTIVTANATLSSQPPSAVSNSSNSTPTTSSAIATISTLPTVSLRQDPSANHAGLRAGAVAGIAAGVGLVAIGLALALQFWYIKRRKSQGLRVQRMAAGGMLEGMGRSRQTGYRPTQVEEIRMNTGSPG